MTQVVQKKKEEETTNFKDKTKFKSQKSKLKKKTDDNKRFVCVNPSCDKFEDTIEFSDKD